jgi:WD40 repeat protein
VGKRFAVMLVVLLISGLCILGYFLQQGRRTLLTDPYKAITTDACIVIETVDLQSFINSLTTGNGLFGEMEKVKAFETFNRKIKFLADQMNKPGYKKIMGSSSSVIAFHISGKGKPVPLLSMAVSSDLKIRQLKDIMRLSGIKTINERNMHGKNVLELPYVLNNQKDTAYLSIISGLLVCCSSKEVITEAILQTSRDNDVRSMPGFSRILQASGKNEDKVFVIFSNLKDLFRTAFRKEYTSIAQKIGKIADCAGGDIYMSENGLVLSGYAESLDPSEILYKYKSAIPGLFHTYKILPAATVISESVIMNAAGNPVKAWKNEAEDLAGKIKEYTGEEITRALIDIRGRPINENRLLIYELKNRVFAEKIFLDKFSGLRAKDNVFYFQPDDLVKVPVYLTPYKGFASAMIPGFEGDFDDSYFAFYDNFLITGNSFITISRLLYDNLLNKTLANDLVYRDFESTLPSIAGYSFYCVPSRIIEYLAEYLNKDIINLLRSNRNSLDKIQAAGYQFVSSNNMIYNSLSIRFKDKAREVSSTEWETLLDTIAAVKPFFFTNHTTGAKEIFIQDMKNNAYLINTAGRVLWKVPLSERIRGNIYMIDFLRNGKYQLLFSGRNYIHLLDRNGNYVERYPVKLRSPATNSLALFDYDNNRNYRLLIAGEDKLIYAYDKEGNVVKGWKPFRTNGTVSSEISWFRVSGKDYLVISDETSLYFIDRTGNKRLTLKEPVTKARGSAIRLISGASPSVVCTSSDGTIQQITFDGNVKKISLRQFSSDHCFDIFDVNGDGFGEYIFIDQGMLYLYNHNRTEVFTREFGSDELGGPINFVFSASDRKIGVFDINKKLIYLIDRNGDTMKGFPLRGASMFSIGKLSDKSGWHLIVGGTDRFLYNYKLETDIN